MPARKPKAPSRYCRATATTLFPALLIKSAKLLLVTASPKAHPRGAQTSFMGSENRAKGKDSLPPPWMKITTGTFEPSPAPAGALTLRKRHSSDCGPTGSPQEANGVAPSVACQQIGPKSVAFCTTAVCLAGMRGAWKRSAEA